MCSEEKSITEYSFSDDTGDAHIVVYRPFSGVEVAYVSAHMGEFDFSLIEKLLCTLHRSNKYFF